MIRARVVRTSYQSDRPSIFDFSGGNRTLCHIDIVAGKSIKSCQTRIHSNTLLDRKLN